MCRRLRGASMPTKGYGAQQGPPPRRTMGVARGSRSGLFSEPHGRRQSGGPPAPRWPRETRAACAFTFDMDAETLWMARNIQEPVTLSKGRFGSIEPWGRVARDGVAHSVESGPLMRHAIREDAPWADLRHLYQMSPRASVVPPHLPPFDNRSASAATPG